MFNKGDNVVLLEDRGDGFIMKGTTGKISCMYTFTDFCEVDYNYNGRIVTKMTHVKQLKLL